VDGPLRARAFLSHVGTLAVLCPAFLGESYGGNWVMTR
jgi:hypothetical protein